MDVGNEYRIHFAGLKEGLHEFSYKLSNKFFELYDPTDFKTGYVEALVALTKRSSFLEFHFQLTGYVDVQCDRCLESFSMPISSTHSLFVKFGEVHQEESDELVVLPVGEDHIDLSQYFYEFLSLALPLKRVHPLDKEGQSGCNPEMLEKLKKLSVEENETIDPRWEDLKRLNINKN